MASTSSLDTLIRELALPGEARTDTLERVKKLVALNITATAASTAEPGTASSAVSGQPLVDSDLNPDTGSVASADNSEIHDDDETLYVRTPLEPQSYDEGSLRSHLRNYQWDELAKRVLVGVIGDPERLSQQFIPDTRGPHPDRSHHAHYQVFDIGRDGCPKPCEYLEIEQSSGRAMALWEAIRTINVPPAESKAAGRITIIREPSPILFGAAHHTLSRHFDMDEVFRMLVNSNYTVGNMHRIFDDDLRRRRSFVFSFGYFTLLGKDCQPMEWQMSGIDPGSRDTGGVSIATCNSVVALALALEGPAIRKIKSPKSLRSADNLGNGYGLVYDTFGPWHVLNLQCYPDYKASLDIHDSTKRYTSGPEAFMNAYRRFMDISKRTTHALTPPLEILYAQIRDQMLFDDDDNTLIKKYFWAYQALGIIGESISATVETYEDNFANNVWDGEHRTLWPLLDPMASKSKLYKRKMAVLRGEFEAEILKLKRLVDACRDRRREILGMREELSVGSTIYESRKASRQGRNIQLLILVSILFLPLTFVTSVFGMTNMPTTPHYWPFGLALVCVCIPLFFLIGSLNTTGGMDFWQRQYSAVSGGIQAVFGKIRDFTSWMNRKAERKSDSESEDTIQLEIISNRSLRPHASKFDGMPSAPTRLGMLWQNDRRRRLRHSGAV